MVMKKSINIHIHIKTISASWDKLFLLKEGKKAMGKVVT